MTGLSGLLLCQGNLLSLDRRKDDGKVTEYWTRLLVPGRRFHPGALLLSAQVDLLFICGFSIYMG